MKAVEPLYYREDLFTSRRPGWVRASMLKTFTRRARVRRITIH